MTTNPRVSVGAIFGIALVAASLSGCTDVRRAIGWDRTTPDEFQVVPHTPLVQPPDYDLRPPDPGAPRVQDNTSREQVRHILVSNPSGQANAVNDPAMSSGEKALLGKAGFSDAPPDIREKVDEEATALVKTDKSFTDELMFWRKTPPPGRVVDPTKEAKRLQQDASLGKAPNVGDTPQIVRRQKGWLEDIF
jgi:hypothetical protein